VRILLTTFAILLGALPGLARAAEPSCVSSLQKEQIEAAMLPKEFRALLEQARFLDAKAEFQTLRARRIREISNPMHAPTLLDHGRKTDYVVVLTHGLYDSPNSHRALAKKFYDKGMNVVMPLLPGHWSKDPTKLDRVSYRDFLREQKRAIQLAKKMGKKVILAGHSTGGLLAVDSAIKDPSIAGLVLAAPALDLSPEAAVIAKIGAFFEGTNANYFMRKQPDPYYMPYYSAHAGNEVQKLVNEMRRQNGFDELPFFDNGEELAYKRRMYSRIKAPTFVMTAGKDVAIDNDEVDIFVSSTRGPRKQVRADNLKHTDLGNFAPAEAKRGLASETSGTLRGLWNATDRFLDENLPGLRQKPIRAAY
jgi:alpha-beta hydrolase superfamily lysophospholipase